jgi:multidrug efflux pump
MSFTDTFIRRPVLATSLNLVILLLGLSAWSTMTVRQYPKVVSTLITVTTAYPGASPSTVQGFVTTRLEQAIASAPGIDYMTGSSAQSVSTITVYVKLNYNPNAALAQVLSKVQQVESQLPNGTQTPVVNETVGNQTALMYLAFYSKRLNQQQVNDYVLRVAQPDIQSVPGVGQAQIVPAGTGPSGNSFAVRVWLNPNRMAALGISPQQVVAALAANNFVSAVGRTRSELIARTIRATTSLHTIKSFRHLIVEHVGNTLVRLGEIAHVTLGAQNYNQAVFYDGIPAVFVGVFATPNANSLSVASGVHRIYRKLKANLPPGIHAAIPYDGSTFILSSMHEVMATIAITLAIVVLVIYLFLGSLRSLLIPAVAIPLSIIGAGIFMELAHYTINLLTLLAVILAIGLVVDDAIIVVENVHRHLEDGYSPMEAARLGVGELATPIIVMATTLVAVFIPIGLTGGLTGALFAEFAFTLVFTVVVSAVVALTLSPMLSSRILRHTPPQGMGHALDVAFEKLRSLYDRSLAFALDVRGAILVIAVAVLVAIPIFFLGTPKELAPTEDQGLILVAGTAPPTATLQYLERASRQIYAVFRSFPQTKQAFQIDGISLTGGAGDNSLLSGMKLVPWSQRTVSQMALMPEVQAKLNRLADIQAAAFPKPSLPGSAGGFPIQFVLQSTRSYRTIDHAANALIGAAMGTGKFAFLTKDLRYDNPQITLRIHRRLAADLGITMEDIGLALAPLLGGNYVNRFNLKGRSYKVIPQVPNRFRLDPSALGRYYVPTASGQLIPLSTLVSVHTTVEPEFLPQFQQLNSATVEGVMMPGVTLGQALSELKTLSRKILPSGFTINYASSSRQYIQQGNTIVWIFLLSIVLVYLLLAAQFESFRDPWIVLITVPMAVSGALAFLYLGAATLNIYTEVGLVTLIGLITKQGILIVQFANTIQETEGLDRFAAVRKASSIRLRPILMTTGAMVIGVLPLVFASGAGAVSRYNMGLIIATGLSIGALFSLYVVPVLYTYIGHERTHSPEPPPEGSEGGHHPGLAAA